LITLVEKEDFGVITFGDLVNVQGSRGSLNKLRLKGKEIRVVYSPLESLKIAKENSNKKYILIGVGFETTAPNIAYTIPGKNVKNENRHFIWRQIWRA